MESDRRAQMRSATERWRRTHREDYEASYKRTHLKTKLAKHGMTIAQYEQLVLSQGYQCAICGKRDMRRLNIDHDPRTNEVRGLLCSGCNGATLGRFADDPERILASAKKYEKRAQRLRRAAEYVLNPPAKKVT